MKKNLKFTIAIGLGLAAQSPVFAQLLFKYTLSQTGATVCVQAVPQFTDATACYHGGNAVLITPTSVSIEAADITNGLGSWSIATSATFMGINFFQFGSETQSNNQSFVNGTAVTLFCVNIDQGECTSGEVRLMLQTNHNTPAGTDPDMSLYLGGVQHTVTASLANNCNPENGTVFDGLTGTTSYPCAALPVELVSFEATAVEKSVVLNWQSASEINFAGYELQRSTNGNDFTKIAWVDGIGASGYQKIDHEVKPNITYYYRLNLVDLDAKQAFSELRSAKLKAGPAKGMVLSPNPAKRYFKVEFETSQQGSATLELLNPLGQLTYVEHFQLNEGQNALMVATANQPEGTYLVKLKTVDGVFSEQIIISKN